MRKFLVIFLSLICVGANAAGMFDYKFCCEKTNRLYRITPQSTVLLGDDHIEMQEWWELFGDDPSFINLGIYGNYSDDILRTIDEVIARHPARIVLMAGLNDLSQDKKKYFVHLVRNISEITKRIRQDSPQTDLHIVSLLPCTPTPSFSFEDILTANDLLRGTCEQLGSDFIDIAELFLKSDENGYHLNEELIEDGRHLNSKGYLVLAKELSKALDTRFIFKDLSSLKKLDLPSLSTADRMRVETFRQIPVKDSDILILGGQNMEGIEWHNLVGDDRVKNRALGVQSKHLSFDQICEALPHILYGSSAPAQIWLQGGDNAAEDYIKIIREIRTLAPSSQIFVMSAFPSGNDAADRALNDAIRHNAESSGCHFVDVWTPLTAKGIDECFRLGEMNERGYSIVSRIIADTIGATPGRKDDIVVLKNLDNTAAGAQTQELLKLVVHTTKPCKIRKIKIKFEQGQQDVDYVWLKTKNGCSRSVRVLKRKSTYRIPCYRTFEYGDEITIYADLRKDAKEGDVIAANVNSLKGLNAPEVLNLGSPTAGREVFLSRDLVFWSKPENGKLANPAVIAAKDGTLLAFCDNGRSIFINRSFDNGRSWNECRRLLKGYIRPAVAKTASGKIMLCCQSALPKVRDAAEGNSSRIYFMLTDDSGKSWSDLRDISDQIFGPDAASASLKGTNYAGFSPGNGLTTSNGRIYFALSVLNPTTRFYDCYSASTQDEGDTWEVSSNPAYNAGIEAKLVESSLGRMLASCSKKGHRGFNYSYSEGRSWESRKRAWKEMFVAEANGDLRRYGDYLLQILPNSPETQDLTVFVSKDDGYVWTAGKNIFREPCKDSSFTILPDGTIGVCIESRLHSQTEIWYESLSLENALKN